MEEWLRGGFSGHAGAAGRDSTLHQRDPLGYEEIDRTFEAHRRRKGDWSQHLWNLYVVSVWRDSEIAGRR